MSVPALWILVIALLCLAIWLIFRPISIKDIQSNIEPVTNFEDAVARVKSIQEEDNQDMARDVCVTKIYDHGKQTDHVIVLLHGFTNFPEQFNELGRQYFEAGSNVLIPRMPYHGLSDRLTDALINLTSESLTEFGDNILNVAHGLGKKVTFLGVSGSGTLVAWLAQHRADVDYAFVIAPLFGLAFVPSPLTKLFEQIALRLPNFFLWWDPRTKADNPYSIEYAYPRYPWRALAEIMRLGIIVRAQAAKSPPKGGNITIVINDSEPAVSNAEIYRLINLWKKNYKGTLNEYHFEKELKLPHDIITPGTPGVPMTEIQQRLIGAVKDAHAKLCRMRKT